MGLAPSPTADIFSLGLLIFEMLSNIDLPIVCFFFLFFCIAEWKRMARAALWWSKARS